MNYTLYNKYFSHTNTNHFMLPKALHVAWMKVILSTDKNKCLRIYQ